MVIQYPRIDDAYLIPLRALEAMLKTNADLLTRNDCPYPPTVREFLASHLGKGQVEVVRREYSEDDLEAEITALYNDLKTASFSVSATDPKDKIAMLKTSGDLLGKMVALKERVLNLRQMAQFQKAIVQLMEGVLTPAQRSEFVAAIGKHIDLSDARPSLLGQEHPGDPAPAASEGPAA